MENVAYFSGAKRWGRTFPQHFCLGSRWSPDPFSGPGGQDHPPPLGWGLDHFLHKIAHKQHSLRTWYTHLEPGRPGGWGVEGQWSYGGLVEGPTGLSHGSELRRTDGLIGSREGNVQREPTNTTGRWNLAGFREMLLWTKTQDILVMAQKCICQQSSRHFGRPNLLMPVFVPSSEETVPENLSEFDSITFPRGWLGGWLAVHSPGWGVPGRGNVRVVSW